MIDMPQVLRVSPQSPDPAVIREAADMIRLGEDWAAKFRQAGAELP